MRHSNAHTCTQSCIHTSAGRVAETIMGACMGTQIAHAHRQSYIHSGTQACIYIYIFPPHGIILAGTPYTQAYRMACTLIQAGWHIIIHTSTHAHITAYVYAYGTYTHTHTYTNSQSCMPSCIHASCTWVSACRRTYTHTGIPITTYTRAGRHTITYTDTCKHAGRHLHPCTHRDWHAGRRTHIHAYTLAGWPAYIPAGRQASIHPCILTHRQASIHTYAYTHTHIHTGRQAGRDAYIRTYIQSDIQARRQAYMLAGRDAYIHTRILGTHAYAHTDIQADWGVHTCTHPQTLTG